ncbi:MAG TPA: 4-(cytidine 5'-diphospho)-2-C-methyl-D-erythritol kinase, partial [Flavisolibacter sp.]
MIVFPNCKINLGLHILRKREDGYHDLQTIFYPLPLQDALEVVRHPAPLTDVEYSGSGLPVQGSLSDNICIKAYHLLKQDFPDLPSIKMHLHKSIPMGAGLGGGSADGAFTLLLLNKKFNLGLAEQKLIRYALELGSDCPFFIRNKPSFATSRGEDLENFSIDLSAYKFAVVNPGIHVPTGWAFSQLKPAAGRPSLKEIIHLPIEIWKASLTHDFEGPVSQHFPEIAAIKSTLYEKGALYAAMTGS